MGEVSSGMYMLIMFIVLCVSGADPDGLCFYCGVSVGEVLCDVCGVGVPNSVMYKCDKPLPSPCLLSRLRGV